MILIADLVVVNRLVYTKEEYLRFSFASRVVTST